MRPARMDRTPIRILALLALLGLLVLPLLLAAGRAHSAPAPSLLGDAAPVPAGLMELIARAAGPQGVAPGATIPAERAAEAGKPLRLTPGGAGPLNLTPAAGWPYESNLANRELGWHVSTAGDVNGDGYSDLVAVGSGFTSTTNSFWLFLGGPGGPTLAPGYPILSGLPSGSPSCGAAGDLNGDGYADVVVGFPNLSGGTVYVYYGKASGLDTAHPWVYSVNIGASELGQSVGTAGDVNGDGYDDLIVGTPGYGAQIGLCGGTAANYGRVDVFYGGPSGLPASASWSLFGCQFLSSYSYLGQSVGTAGDVNGDGFDDIIVGAPNATPAGEAYVFLGSASGLPTYAGGLGFFGARITIEGVNPGDEFGTSVGTAGDVNGDGFADVIVGASMSSFFSLTNCGEARIYRGASTGMDTTLFWNEFGPSAGAHFGYAVGTAGDVNGDGLADVVVGAPDYSATGQSGLVAVFQSYKSTMLSTVFATGPTSGSQLGFSVGTAGDVNGDGFSDVVAGEPDYSNGQSFEGAIQLYYGGGDKPATVAGWTRPGDFASPNYAWSVAGAGDVNGDGYDDYLIGDPSYSDGGGSNRGRVFLVYGNPTAPTTVWSAIGVPGEQLGISVASAGDVNGDGFDDIVVGGHAGGTGVGKVKIWYGGASVLAIGQYPDSILATASGTQFGGSVASAGDVNGDGYADIIVGAPTDMSTLASEGSVFVYHGGPTGISHTVAWSAHGGQANAHMGQSVAGGGDLNGDGYSDIVAGVPGFDEPAGPFLLVDSGRILWALGSSGGLGVQHYVEGGGNMNLGGSVAFAGDVNGDGYSDVIAGAIGYQPNLQGEGGAFVYAGSPSGLNASAIWGQAGGETFAAFGSSVASAGDIDGDGLSDVIVGSVFMDAGGPQDQGKVFVYRGPLTAGEAPTWTAVGGGTFANIGHTVANAGDVNGDGWNDLIFGLPGFNGRQGDARLYYGAGGLGQLRPHIATRAPGGAPVPLLGRTGGSGIDLVSIGRSAAGRTRVRLEWKLAPVVGQSGAAVAGRQAAFTPTNSPGTFGSLNIMAENVAGLTPGDAYTTLLRTVGHSPYFPTSPWVAQARNGRREADARVPGDPAAVGPDALPGALALAAARPNPTHGPATVSFALTRPGPVRLEVLDLQGRRVRMLADGVMSAGPHEATWDGRDDQGGASAPGLYFLRLAAEGTQRTGKLALVR